MLPPVNGISALDAALQSIAARQDIPSVRTDVLPQKQEPQSDSVAIFAKTSILSASNEISLSQTTSILAETLGKLTNLPRSDGESADAYVNRLLQTVQQMPPEQRLSIERQLAKMFQGLTLTAIINALKSESGLEAARLAITLELAETQGVKNQPSTRTDSPERPTTSNPAPISSNSNESASRTQSSPEQKGSTYEAFKSASATNSRQIPLSNLISGAAAMPEVENATAKNLATASNPTRSTLTSSVGTSAPQTPGETQPSTSNLPARSAAVASADVTTPDDQPPAKVGSQIANVTVDEATHVTRRSHQSERQVIATPMGVSVKSNELNSMTQFTTASARDMEALLVAALLGKLPKRATPSQSVMQSASTPTYAPFEDAKSNASLPMAPVGTSVSRQQSGNLDSLEPATARMAMAQPQTASEPKLSLSDQPQFQNAVAAAVLKEGIPVPFIDYPLAKDEPESDTPHRGRWPSSGDENSDNDGHQDSADDTEKEDRQEERVAANDEHEPSLLDEENLAADEDSAEAYYLKMTNFG